jgi:hypothetical protein
VGLAVGALALVRRSVEVSRLVVHQDVAGFILAVVGVVYAVLLAFVVIAVWQQFEAAQATSEQEAVAVGSLYRDALVQGASGAPARRALREYAHSVVESEWPEMAEQHRDSGQTDAALDRVWGAFRLERPAGTAEAPFHEEAVKRLHDVSELRRTRIFESSNALPGPLWGVLIAGALITIGFTYFFGVASLRAQVLMVSALASIVGLALFPIVVLDLPFTGGGVGVEPAAMKGVIREFSHYAR